MTAITITDLNTAQLDVNFIAELATSSALTATDRLGQTRRTMAGALNEYPNAFANAAAAEASRLASGVSAGLAATAKAAAEAARDAAVLNVPVYATIAAGRAAVVDGAVFAVLPGGTDSLLRETRYRRDGESTQTKLGEVFSAEEWDAVFQEFGGLYSLDPVAVSIVDESGRRSWLEVAPDGGPTAHAEEVVASVTQPTFDDRYNPEPLALSIADASDRRSWLEIKKSDGGPSQHAIDKIAAALPEFEATKYRDEQGNVRPVVSGDFHDVVCWGDSMTAGAGGAGTTYPDVLASLSGRTVHNAGVGGETSVTICGRSGANPFILSVQGGSIPASGGVTVTFDGINAQVPAPLIQGAGTPGGTFAGTLKGVPGIISLDAGVYTFTRTAAGSAITANRPEPYYTDWGKARRNDIWIIWIGQNGPSDARAIEDARAMIQHMDALNKRWLVIPKPTSNDATDALFFGEFGRRCLLWRQYAVAYGLQDAGITPTSQDDIDIANGVIPTSLRVDAVHGNASYYTVLGTQVHRRLAELGWL